MALMTVEEVNQHLYNFAKCSVALDDVDNRRAYLPPRAYQRLATAARAELGLLLALDSEEVLGCIRNFTSHCEAGRELFELEWVSQLIKEVPKRLTELADALMKTCIKEVK